MPQTLEVWPVKIIKYEDEIVLNCKESLKVLKTFTARDVKKDEALVMSKNFSHVIYQKRKSVVMDSVNILRFFYTVLDLTIKDPIQIEIKPGNDEIFFKNHTIVEIIDMIPDLSAI